MLSREAGADAYERKFKGSCCYFPHISKWLYVKSIGHTEDGNNMALVCIEKNANHTITEDPDYVRKPTGYYAMGTNLFFLQRRMAKLWLIGIAFTSTHTLKIISDGNFSDQCHTFLSPELLNQAKRLGVGDKSAGCTVISDLILLSKKHLFFGTDIIATKKNGKLVPLTTLPQTIIDEVKKAGEVFA